MVSVAAFSVGTSLQNLLNDVANFLPRLIVALLILIIGRFVAKLLGRVVTKVLSKAGVDRVFAIHELKDFVARFSPNASLAAVAGALVYWILFLFILSAALTELNLAPVNNFLQEVFNYIPNLVAAIIIIAVAVVLAGFVGGAVNRVAGDTGTGKVVASVVPTVILVIGAFMAIDQLKIAQNIVHIAFGATSAGLALGFALAFGLGGAKTAEKLIEQAHGAAVGAVDGVKQDVATIRARGLAGLQTPPARGGSSAGAARPGGTGPDAPTSVNPVVRPDDPAV